jgi:hypothetical protein
MSDELKRHERLYDEYLENEANWTSIGYPSQVYQNWLEEMIMHWRTCATARSREGKYVYSQDDHIANLQETVNQQAAEISELRRRLELQGGE